MAEAEEKPRPTLAETFGEVANKLLQKDNAVDYRDGALETVSSFWKLWDQANKEEQADLTSKMLAVLIEEARTHNQIKNALFLKGRKAAAYVCDRLATEFLKAQKQAPVAIEPVQKAIGELKYFGQFYMDAAAGLSKSNNKNNVAASETCFALTKRISEALSA